MTVKNYGDCDRIFYYIISIITLVIYNYYNTNTLANVICVCNIWLFNVFVFIIMYYYVYQ